MITREQVLQEINYDPETGEFTRIKPRCGTRTGIIRNKPNAKGYISIRVGALRPIRAHHLAWLISYGEWPSGQIDHRDRNPANNRLSNLRLASAKENSRNRSLRKDNALRLKGVWFDRQNNRFRAQICVDGKTKYLGNFMTAEEAAAAYETAAADLFGEFSPTN